MQRGPLLLYDVKVRELIKIVSVVCNYVLYIVTVFLMLIVRWIE